MITRLIITSFLVLTAGCSPSHNPTTLITPETFDTGIEQLDRMLKDGKVEEAREYVELHRKADPVIYWAFQVHLNDVIICPSGFSNTIHSYEEFAKAYLAKFSSTNNTLEK